LEADRVRALGALCSLQSKPKLAAEKRQVTHFLSKEEIEKWIDNSVERAMAGARKQLEDAEAAVQQEQEETRKAENTGLMLREAENTFQEMMVAIGESLSDLAGSDDGEDGEDEDDEEKEQGKMSKDEEPGWVLGAIYNTVQLCMERYRQKQMKLDELTQPGWGDAANWFRESDKKYGTSDLSVLAVINPQTEDDAAARAPTTIGELIECVDIVPGILQMPQETSRPGSRQLWVGSRKPQSNTSISGPRPAVALISSLIQNAKPFVLGNLHPCI